MTHRGHSAAQGGIKPMIYEILYIIPSKFSDTEIDGVRAAITGRMEAAGAKIEKTENLGKLKLAYTVKKFSHGTYILVFVDAASEAMAKIDQDLRLADEVLRYTIVKRPQGIPKTIPMPSSYVAPLTSEGKRTAGAAGKKELAKVAAPMAPAAVAAEPISAEELDKKLDEILDDTNLDA